ncbi:hypothetical protein BDF20DRAFT_144888 [Mycotypha africana]|uniref:uncharacterized protein n=1 Tax=Mycotypha africana TaxID=64632 RepID=UPI0023016C32|nr:uncharacterized protein BDF20DRAFT_144888 [Mycotypha africana]KAI8969100.1 hypothetical protein BDF20DRAFT_144888 [Mycotypha africana]
MRFNLPFVIIFILTNSSFTTCKDYISVNSPKLNDVISSQQLLNISYTFTGIAAEQRQTSEKKSNTYLPSSLQIEFSWTEQTNRLNSLSFEIAKGLSMKTGGTYIIHRTISWRVPNYHFFARYPPSRYDFALVFTPYYPRGVLRETAQNNSTADVLKNDPQHQLQKPIVVPVFISVIESNSRKKW